MKIEEIVYDTFQQWEYNWQQGDAGTQAGAYCIKIMRLNITEAEYNSWVAMRKAVLAHYLQEYSGHERSAYESFADSYVPIEIWIVEQRERWKQIIRDTKEVRNQRLKMARQLTPNGKIYKNLPF